MTDLKAPSDPDRSDGRSAPQEERDPLESLYKMSTTAGLATQEYVAINNTAIVAFVLGAASMLALLSYILLVIPLAAVVCAIMAWRQIRRSNGTQTGTGLAIAGLVLALASGGFVVAQRVAHAARERTDIAALNALVEKYGQHISDGKYAEAYDLSSDGFKKRYDRPAFEARWRGVQNYAGRSIVGIRSNGLYRFETIPDSDSMRASTAAKVRYQGVNEESLYALDAYKETGHWYIDDIPQIFGNAAPKSNAPAGGAGPAEPPG